MALAWARAAQLLRGAVGLGEAGHSARRGSLADRGRSASGPATTQGGGALTPRERRQTVLRRQRTSSLWEDRCVSGVESEGPCASPSLQDHALRALAVSSAEVLAAAGGVPESGVGRLQFRRLKELPADLLQRLMEAMVEMGVFEEACLNIFAGEHLKSLRLAGYPGACAMWVRSLASSSLLECDLSQCPDVGDEALSALAAGSSRLRRLRLNGCFRLTNVGLERLSALGSLVDLELEGLELLGRGALVAVGGLSSLLSLSLRMSGNRSLPDDEVDGEPESGLGPDLGSLGSLTKLRILRLGWVPGVVGEHLAFLSHMTELQELELCHTGAGDSFVEFLAPLAGSLRKLNMAGCPITSVALPSLARLEALESLNLGWCRVGDGVGCLRTLVQLRYLNLPCTRTTDGALAELGSLQALECLNLDSCLVSDGGLYVCQKFRRLKLLDISDTRVGDPGLEHLSALSQLHSLNLSFTLVTDQGMRSLSGLASLRRLTLDTRLVTDKGLAPLTALSGLTHLDLFGASISDRGARYLEAFRNLQSLEICGGCLTDVGVVYVSRLPNLTHLNLAQNQCITDACLPHISKLNKLRSLNLAHSRVSGTALQRYLLPLQKLERLALYSCQVNERSLEQLSAVLPNLESVGR